MFIGLVFGAFAAFLVAWGGLGASKLIGILWLRRLTLALTLVGAIGSGAMTFEALSPQEPTASGIFSAVGDRLSLDSQAPGLLRITCKTLDGVDATRKRLNVGLRVQGSANHVSLSHMFQVGDNTADMYNPLESLMAASERLDSVGSDANVTLERLSKAGVIAVHVAFHPERIPFTFGMYVLAFLTLLAAALEGATPDGWQRTFLTVILVGITAFIWLGKDGLTAEDSMWTIWIKLVFATMAGAGIGTFAPSIFGRFLPELPLPDRPSTATTPPPIDHTPTDYPHSDSEPPTLQPASVHKPAKKDDTL